MFLFKRKTRTRIAPSPTGPLHIGTARSALYNYLFAAQKGGKLILRIEDTDTKRSKKEFEKNIINSLEWLQIKYDKLYRQSERKKIYKKYINKLLKNGDAFWCYHTIEELRHEKNQQLKEKKPSRHVCEHKNEETRNMRQATNGIIRLKGSDEKIRFNDIIRGQIEFDAILLGDISIAKDEETPLYNLAVVIDDYEMKISHVIRGEDHISNTPKQILIKKSLGIKTPEHYYAHLPLILGPDKSKLSKRHGATSVTEYIGDGYLPQAMINFMSMLGWNPGDDKEMFNIDQLIEKFSIAKVQKSGAIFNINKLNWYNSQYIKQIPDKELSKILIMYLPKKWRKLVEKEKKFWFKIVTLEKERLSKLSDIKQGIEFFFEKPAVNKHVLPWKDESPKNTQLYIDTLIKILSNIKPRDFNSENVKKSVWNFAEKKGRGNVLWPFRVALTGLSKSPDPFSICDILGKNETIERLKYARSIL